MRKATAYTPEFKAEAVKLVIEQGLSYQEAAAKLDILTGTLKTGSASAATVAPVAQPLHLWSSCESSGTPKYTTAPRTRACRDGARDRKKAAAYFAKCSIPDDCIDYRRYPLFMASSVMRELIEQLQSEVRGMRTP